MALNESADRPEARGVLQRSLDQSGGSGLLLAAEDPSNQAQKALGIKSHPALVIVGATGTVDHVFSGSVAPNFLYKFLAAT